MASILSPQNFKKYFFLTTILVAFLGGSGGFAKDPGYLCPDYLHGPESVEVTHKGITAEMIKIEDELLLRFEEFGRKDHVKHSDALGFIVSLKSELVGKLKAFREKYRADVRVKRLLDHTIETLDMGEKYLKKLEERMRVIAGADNALDNKEFQELLHEYSGRMKGELGEVEVALQVHGFRVKGVSYDSIAAASGLQKGTYPNGEIDIVFKTKEGKLAWAEVKNYEIELNSGKGFGEKVYAQMQKMREFSLMVGDGKIELHIFVKNGMDAEMKRRFEELGVVVHSRI